MYKLEITKSKYGFMYIIYKNELEIRRGYRISEHEARISGIEELNFARSFRIEL